ncbi:Uncharacterized protein OS=Variovorax paradoxus (strain S110) GN=Vapar_2490 PE=4 SV=1 [Gemmata massiliana]|uniref:Uncharacterized protein n=1 Tax=Gemmata massiliana TaxID=1210884 RepID=A0A6P2CYW9_9BACT|nr:hypothetical protein [Gemmata massiliana]VTR94089.1 Uncharacterized protein OS=Variovorax paradoxus (strain S110) GN=Vapar_2490 PE=4 SV=1 [Gemmata massiliana]
MGYELSQRTANKLKALLSKSDPLPQRPVTNTTQRFVTFVEIIGDEISSGYFPCVACQFNTVSDSWEEFSGSCVAIDANLSPLEVDKRYLALHVGINGITEGYSGSGSGGTGTVSQVFVVQASEAGNGTTVADSPWKESVRVATVTAGTLSTSFENGDSIDGVTLSTGNRILVKNQSSASENGIYVVNSSGAPTRATDCDSASDLLGATVVVREGSTQADTEWVCTANAPITIGSTALPWKRVNGDVDSSVSSTTDNYLVRFDGTTGHVIQDSKVTLSDAGVMSWSNFNATVGTNINFNLGNLDSISVSGGFAYAGLSIGGNATQASLNFISGTTGVTKIYGINANYLSGLYLTLPDNQHCVLNGTPGSPTSSYAVIRGVPPSAVTHVGIDSTCTVQVSGVNKTMTIKGGLVTDIS